MEFNFLLVHKYQNECSVNKRFIYLKYLSDKMPHTHDKYVIMFV